jgi:hypothetical protein
MVKLWLTAALVVSLLAGSALAASIPGYIRKEGTYVQPHLRANPNRHPNSNPYDNYGFPGDVNPNTGRTTPGSQDSFLDRYNRPLPPSSNRRGW